jgi:hypothetical protein
MIIKIIIAVGKYTRIGDIVWNFYSMSEAEGPELQLQPRVYIHSF